MLWSIIFSCGHGVWSEASDWLVLEDEIYMKEGGLCKTTNKPVQLFPMNQQALVQNLDLNVVHGLWILKSR